MENVTVKKSGEAYFITFPEEFNIPEDFVIFPTENTLIVAPKGSKIAEVLETLPMFSDDLFEDWKDDEI